MGYFRAILFKKEVSKRAYDLTAEVLRYNPGDYNAWSYRRQLIDELHIPLQDEFAYLNEIAILLEKNFQVWHHRRCLMELYQSNFEQEFSFLDDVFLSDAKNYHAWSYRLWLVSRFDLYKDQLDWLEDRLEDDVTNNSLWSYRRFIVAHTKPFNVETVKEET